MEGIKILYETFRKWHESKISRVLCAEVKRRVVWLRNVKRNTTAKRKEAEQLI